MVSKEPTVAVNSINRQKYKNKKTWLAIYVGPMIPKYIIRKLTAINTKQGLFCFVHYFDPLSSWFSSLNILN